MKPIHLFTVLSLLSLLLISCNEKEAANTSQKLSGGSALDSFFVAQAPSGAKEISQIFADPTPGKEIVVSGEVMGRMHPFVDGRAMVVLGDPTKITPCNRIPGDLCETPWDNCCDDPDVLKTSVTTIQFLDDEGKVLRAGLKGYKGIKELSFLTVKGKIAEGSNAANLLVNAESFHVTDPSPYLNAKPAGDYSDKHCYSEGAISEDNITEEDGVFIYTKE